MDENAGWLSRVVQYFGPLVAAWSAFLAYLVHLKKLRDAEKAATHNRLLAEIDHLISERDVAREECDMVRDRLAERDQRISDLLNEKAEMQGRAVIAEATLIARDKAAGRPTMLSDPEAMKPDA